MSTELIKVTINGQGVYVEVAKGARLIDVCREKGLPEFHRFAITRISNCRHLVACVWCVSKKMPKLQTLVHHYLHGRHGRHDPKRGDRGKLNGLMGEFLLANHPLDCPVCDRGGECELQEVIFDWGDVEERFTEKKNAQPEKYLSPIVANDPQRCILCKRCTRVCDEWMGEERDRGWQSRR